MNLNTISKYFRKNIIVFVLIIITSLFILWINRPSETDEIRVKDAKNGNEIVNSIFDFYIDSSRFPSSISNLYPNYLNYLPDTTWKTGWHYCLYTDSSPECIFELSTFTVGYKTRLQYCHNGFDTCWIVNSEGQRSKLKLETPSYTDKVFMYFHEQ